MDLLRGMNKALFCALLALTVSACKSPEEKVCDHMKKFVDDGKYTDAECEKDKEKFKKRCKDPEKYFECLLTKNDEKALKECESSCEKTEEKK